MTIDRQLRALARANAFHHACILLCEEIGDLGGVVAHDRICVALDMAADRIAPAFFPSWPPAWIDTWNRETDRLVTDWR